MNSDKKVRRRYVQKFKELKNKIYSILINLKKIENDEPRVRRFKFKLILFRNYL